MNIKVKVPKDFKNIKTKFIFNLTLRQFIGFSIACILGFFSYTNIRTILTSDVSIIMMIIITFPIFFITIFEKDGIYIENHVKYFILFNFYNSKKRFKEEYVEKQKYFKRQKRI